MAVVPQIDIGSLSLQGLSSFSTMLAAFSADNVAPTAMVEMEQLGSMFLMSGKHADKVPDLLQRCSTVRLDRLALSIGWRKGDSASIMAQSAGGQAIALLSVALGSLYNDSSLGDVLKSMSRKLLPAGASIAGIGQLVAVARLLEKKLAALGFGNFMAHQVVQIHKMHQRLPNATPKHLLFELSSDTMKDILVQISQALRQEHAVIRIRGAYAAGYLLSLVLFMFPEDTLVTCDSIVVTEGTRKPHSIIFEFGKNKTPTGLNAHLEIYLEQSNGLKLPIEIESKSPFNTRHQFAFTWHHWILDNMINHLTAHGVASPLKSAQRLLQACCNLLMSLVANPPCTNSRSLHASPRISEDSSLTHHQNSNKDYTSNMVIGAYIRLLDSLGAYPQKRVIDCCKTLTGLAPDSFIPDTADCYQSLCNVFPETANLSHQIRCQRNTEDYTGGFERYMDHGAHPCESCFLWSNVGLALFHLFCSLFVDTGVNTVVHRTLTLRTLSTTNRGASERESLYFLDTCLRLYMPSLPPSHGTPLPSSKPAPALFHTTLLSLFCGPSCTVGPDDLAAGPGNQVVVPLTLQSLALSPELPIRYAVYDGNFVEHGHYYRLLRANGENGRRDPPDFERSFDIVPSGAGAHSALRVTIQEKLDHLLLTATARISWMELTINLYAILIGSYSVQRARPCLHDPKSPLNSVLKDECQAVFVGGYTSDPKLIDIALTKDNPEAQLLACLRFRDERLLYAQNCCLDCACRQLLKYRKIAPYGRRGRIIIA